LSRKDRKTFLSPPERPAEKCSGRSPGLGLNLLAAPSHRLLGSRFQVQSLRIKIP
jgi:hypothetical protein